MYRAFKNEMFKLFSTKKIYVLSSVMIFLCFIVAFSMKNLAVKNTAGQSLNAQSFPAYFILEIGINILPVLIVVMSSGFFSDEYRDETMKISLLGPVTRVEFLISKLLANITGIAFLIFITMFFSYIISAVLFGFGSGFVYEGVNLSSVEGIYKTILIYAFTILPLTVFSVVVLMLSELVENSGVVVGIGIGIYFIQVITQNVSVKLSTFMITNYFGSGILLLNLGSSGEGLALFAVTIFYLCISGSILFFNFIRKDI